MISKLAKQAVVCTAALTLIASGLSAQSREDRKVRTPNYELAERFSAKRVGQMVFSTSVRPQWFRNGDKFLYAWKTSEGTEYYIADPKLGKTEKAFDMEKLAMQITGFVRDPFEAKHLPMWNLSIDPENDGILKFDIVSSQEKKDTTGKSTGDRLTYHFSYKISDKSLTYDTTDKDDKYPSWANVSPDGMTGVYMKNSNLFYMDTLNMRKAAKDPKDSTIVWHKQLQRQHRDRYDQARIPYRTCMVSGFQAHRSHALGHEPGKRLLGNQLPQQTTSDTRNLQIPDAGRAWPSRPFVCFQCR